MDSGVRGPEIGPRGVSPGEWRGQATEGSDNRGEDLGEYTESEGRPCRNPAQDLSAN